MPDIYNPCDDPLIGSHMADVSNMLREEDSGTDIDDFQNELSQHL